MNWPLILTAMLPEHLLLAGMLAILGLEIKSGRSRDGFGFAVIFVAAAAVAALWLYATGFAAEPTAEITIDASAEGASVREGTIASNTIQATYSAGGANIRFIGGPGSDDAGSMNRKAGMWTIAGNLIGSQEINIHLLRARGITDARLLDAFEA